MPRSKLSKSGDFRRRTNLTAVRKSNFTTGWGGPISARKSRAAPPAPTTFELTSRCVRDLPVRLQSISGPKNASSSNNFADGQLRKMDFSLKSEFDPGRSLDVYRRGSARIGSRRAKREKARDAFFSTPAASDCRPVEPIELNLTFDSSLLSQ